jgi:hypothetical protein
MAKDYAVETDLIEIPDALYAPGQEVRWTSPYFGNTKELTYQVRDFAWDSLKQTWMYCLERESFDEMSVAEEEAPEADLKPLWSNSGI